MELYHCFMLCDIITLGAWRVTQMGDRIASEPTMTRSLDRAQTRMPEWPTLMACQFGIRATAGVYIRFKKEWYPCSVSVAGKLRKRGVFDDWRKNARLEK
jgi:hypothetical protein